MPSRTASTRSDGSRARLSTSIALLPCLAVVVCLVVVLTVGDERTAAYEDGMGSGASPAAARPAHPLGTVGSVGDWRVGDGRLGATVTQEVSEGDVPQVARAVLAGYRGRPLVLVHAGYLDLLGRCWGCVVWSGEWSEVCVVQGDQDGSSCTVRVMRIEGEGWEE